MSGRGTTVSATVRVHINGITTTSVCIYCSDAVQVVFKTPITDASKSGTPVIPSHVLGRISSTTLVAAASSTASTPNAVIILTACLYSKRIIRRLAAFVPTFVTGTVLVISQVFGILLDIGSLVF